MSAAGWVLMAVLGAAPALGPRDPAAVALLATEAERLGLARKPDTAKQLEQEKSRIAVEHLLRENAKVATPSDAEVRDAYHATADSARLEVIVRATREDAQGALDRLRKGGKVADEVKASLDPTTRAKGGDTGSLPRGRLPPAVSADAFTLPLKSWAGPYDLGGRWVVAHAVERKIAPDPDSAALAQARAHLVAAREERARGEYVAGLRKAAGVRIDEKFLASVAGRPPSAAEREHVIARVGARNVRYADVLAAMGAMAQAHGGAAGAPVLVGVARQRVDHLLLEDAAARAKIAARPEVRTAIAAARREILVGAYYDDVATRTPPPKKAEIEARYRERAADYRAPATRRCAHVVTSSEAKTKEVKARLGRGDAFDRVAREASEDATTREKGGDLGEVPDERLRRMEPALATAIRQLEHGKASDPVKSAMGWHILRCEQVPARPLLLEEAQDRIVAALRFERMQATIDARLKELKAPAAAAKPANASDPASSKAAR